MKYINNSFSIEKVSAGKLAKKFGTPIYCYSLSKLRSNIESFKKHFKEINPLVCFSIKSNANIKILKEIKKHGLGADIVSKGELIAALKAGINPKKIVFSGVGKTYEEIKLAIEKNILLINSETESEVTKIEKIAKNKNKKISIGIRLNPNIDSNTLKKISTGKKEDKFGLTEKNFLNIIKKFKNSKYLNIKCLSVHIGSQITSHIPYKKTLYVVNQIIKKSNHNFEYIDLGGGMGINYDNNTKKLNYKKYNSEIKKLIKKYKSKIIFEPGRSIIGNTGYLLTKVLYIKQTKKINFIILDAAMNDLMRPALYGAIHRILPVNKRNIIKNIRHEFVGPICETTDKFLTLNKYQSLKENDLVIICDVGAYGMSLASNYNLRTKPAEVMIYKSAINLITKRQKLANII